VADSTADRIRKLVKPLRVAPGQNVSLGSKDFDPGATADFVAKQDADEMLAEGVAALADYQARLAAQDTWGVLVILQAMDAAGKDGTISHVMSGVNPQGVEVTSFKVPSSLEQDHDYLWRAALRLPARGMIGIFNRSYYEELLVVRVHPEILAGERMPADSKGPDVWKRRFREINDWERYLTDNGTRIVKLFLHVSKDEQRKRFLDRIEEPNANWKFSAADARERKYWDDYQAAYADLLENTSTERAPWHVIPADHKWFMRVAASSVILDALMDINPKYPVPTAAAKAEMEQAKTELLAGG
jgi:PPK2 family polyphosphate:nucleotide phosphotransferase